MPYYQPESRLGQAEVGFLVEEAPEGGFTARALGVSICTEADSVDQLLARVEPLGRRS